MKQDLRKTPRISEFMPVAVYITAAGGDVLAGPMAGRVVDLCRGGACLLMSQVESGKWHVYHSARQDSSVRLRLVVEQPQRNVHLTLTARPVWCNTFEQDDLQERVIGVAFVDEAEIPLLEAVQSSPD